MKEFVFRMAEAKDAQDIYEIEMKTFAKPWSLAAITDEIRSGENSAYAICCEKIGGVKGTTTGGIADTSSEKPFKSDIHANGKYASCDEGYEKVIGYCGIIKILDEGYITNVAVDDRYRGNGIGYRIMELADKWAKLKNISFLTLEVRKSNYSAIKLYERCGFLRRGTRENYYPDGESVIMMRKDYK